MRLRRSDEGRRYAVPHRSARIDPNPHQIEAVIFALSRLREGGCILADEVGLGKTIEAGLVISQLLAEGAKRVLVATPKPLLGQWRDELYALFGIQTREAIPKPGGFEGNGVFLVGREAAGSEAGRAALLSAPPFDLCVVDEAHEVFAGIYKRFSSSGEYREDSPDARLAGRFREVLRASNTPVLLLTATPIQNTLSELWGLVQYVDPTGTLLGNLPTFRALFCDDGDDRKLAAGQERELKDRLQPVLRRTLRRQAQEFLSQKFVDRHARLFDYAMTPEEHALYDDITRYLLDPKIVAFSGRQRRLLLIGFHRRMASSKRALSASLERVAARLRTMLGGRRSDLSEKDEDVEAFFGDLEDDDFENLVDTGPADAPNPSSVRDELERVKSFIARAGSLAADSKAQALLSAVNLVLSRAKGGDGSGKLVIFTESLATQDYLRELLLESRLVGDEEVTIFRGRNDSIRADQALARWTAEEATRNASQIRPSRDIAVRLALVHEFKTRSKIFISTEAGARGLNLQFCETIVNYDLPWNPQRIEQRIGRCHRYGQKRDVTVINFLARDNEAQRLTFDILSQKLELFGTVLDASDHVLHRSKEGAPETLAGALGAALESEMRRIYERARTVDEIEADLRKLEERMGAERERFETTQARMAGLMQAHLDEDVRRLFRRLQEELPPALASLDRDLDRLVCTYLDSLGVPFERIEFSGHIELRIPPATTLPANLAGGSQVTIGPSREGAPALHLTHPLVVAALGAAQEDTNNRYRVSCRLSGDAPPELIRRRGAHGRLALIKVRYEGFEPVEELLPVVLFEKELSPLAKDLAQRLVWSELRDVDALAASELTNEDVEDAIEEMLFDSESRSVEAEGQRFEQAIAQIERSIHDRMLLLRRRREELFERLRASEVRRDGALGPDARTEAEVRIRTLQGEIDEIDERLVKLEQRDDPEFVRLRDRIHSRHFAPRQVERILDAELVIG